MPLETSKREAKREKLFDAALKVMGDKGFKNATVGDITKEAHVTRSVFYYYFESKADLVEKMIESSNERMFDAYTAAVTPGMSTIDMLLAISRATYRSVLNRPHVAMFFFSEIWHRQGDWRHAMGEAMNEVIFVFADLISKGQDEGIFAPGLNVSFASQMVFAMIATTAAADKEGYIKDSAGHDIGEQVVQFLYAGLTHIDLSGEESVKN